MACPNPCHKFSQLCTAARSLGSSSSRTGIEKLLLLLTNPVNILSLFNGLADVIRQKETLWQHKTDTFQNRVFRKPQLAQQVQKTGIRKHKSCPRNGKVETGV